MRCHAFFIRSLIASIALGCVAGCASLPKPAPNFVVYDLGPPESSPKLAAPALQVRGLEVTAAPWLASSAMHYRLRYAQENRRYAYLESRWVGQPAQLLEVAMKRMVRPSGAATPGHACKLRLELDEFAQEFSTPNASNGVISVRAVLLAPMTDQPLATGAFSVSRPAASADAQGGVQSLREGTIMLAGELLDWLDKLERNSPQEGGVRTQCGG